MKHKLFVFDTNALISANLLKKSLYSVAYNKALELGFMVRSEESFKEFAETFARPKFDKYLPAVDRADALARFKVGSIKIKVLFLAEVCRDPDDNAILSLALAANAACIVTHDKDLLVLNPFRGIPIVTAFQFLELF